ncbi:primase-helicase family protein [Acinetobacter sp. TUM15064]|uniref:primase-helicase family protein n=1 Tax=Acinetobacter sp. TUM15064 TaxID=2609134 RepID=UPI00124D404D|nr:primase-helicase family protein [Acinetobacter sp. TUM15064]
MSEEEILEQPQSNSHLSDFNDLHVMSGLAEVRKQIESGIFSQSSAFAVPPNPLNFAGQGLGQFSAADQALLAEEIYHEGVSHEFGLDTYTEADLIERENQSGGPDSEGQGESQEYERPDFTVEKCLSRFELVEGKTDVWDSFRKKIIKSTAFTKMVGKSVAEKWQSHRKRKMIDADTLKVEVDKLEALEINDLLGRYVHLEGTLESWDRLHRERVKNIAIKEAFPNQYDMWFKSPHRSMIHNTDLIFDPTNSHKSHQINRFTGLEVVALSDPDNSDLLMSKKSAYEKCRSFDQLLRHLCDGEPKAYGWLIRWLAYPLQNKGAKMASSILMHGNIHGAGKSLFFGGVMEKVYSKYHKTLDQRDLESQYNDWADEVLFLLFEEIANNKTKHGMMGFIKHLITGSKLSIHQKFLSSMQQANHMNTVFLSNHTQPLPIEENDRRFLVLYPKSIVPQDLLDQVVMDLDDQSVIDAFYTLLLQIDLTGFNAHTKPPMTKAKQEIIAYTLPGYDTFITHWKAGETDYPYCTCTTMQLYEAYQKWCKITNEHVVSLKRFMGEAKKYGVVSTEKQEHWRKPSAIIQAKQTKVIIVGEMPEYTPDRNGDLVKTSKIDWLGASIEKFDNALHGDDNEPPFPKNY